MLCAVPVAVIVVVVAIAGWIVGPSLSLQEPASGPAAPFSPNSPFNTAIASDAVVDPNSEAVISALAGEGVHAGLVEFGIPIYESDDSTRRYVIKCAGPVSWGPCPLDGVSVPIPDQATPQSGSDGAMVIVDHGNDRVYEFWRAARSGDGWTTTWGSVSRLSGNGWSSTATGAGASRLGGVIRVSELTAGIIPHALVLQSSNTCSDVFRFPAVKTDGNSTRSDCIPEGARLQLDPALEVTAMNSLTPAERAIAVAMQRYGAYVIDTGGAKLSMSFERPADATAASTGPQYSVVGLSWDHMSLSGIPWSRLRLLAAPDGGT